MDILDEQEEAHHSSAAESLTISAQSSNSWQTTDSGNIHILMLRFNDQS
jgi:hypothetical protein